MNKLIRIAPAAAGSLTATEIERVYAFAEAETSAATRRCYASDMRAFVAWCTARRRTPPCPPAQRSSRPIWPRWRMPG